MLEELMDKVSKPKRQVGYIEPGHGLRGKQRCPSSDDDLDKMYEVYKKGEITLWCLEVLRKTLERGHCQRVIFLKLIATNVRTMKVTWQTKWQR